MAEEKDKLKNFIEPFLSKYFIWIIGSLLLIIYFFIYFLKNIHAHDGIFTYVLDDPYIHMAIAKNFSQYGVWGITQYEFSSSSSSILYTFILSLFFWAFGIHNLIPLFLNLFSAIFILIASDIILKKRNISISLRLLSQTLIIFTTPLIPVIFTGMEHIIHAFLNLLFVFFVYDSIEYNWNQIHNSKKKLPFFKKLRKIDIITIILGMLIPLIRFEGIFTILIAILLMILFRNYLLGFALLIFSFIPLSVYGIISVRQGWYFFPNSVVLKGDMNSVFTTLQNFNEILPFISEKLNVIFFQVQLIPLICLLLLISTLISIKTHSFLNFGVILSLFVVSGVFFHGFFAKFCSYCRYEAYLMTLGSVAGISLFQDIIQWVKFKLKPNFNFKINSRIKIVNTTLIISLVLIGYSSSYLRGTDYTRLIPDASTNIYEQQYQMARFLNFYYTGQKVALNDIGAVNFYGDIQCFDFAGLGTIESAKNVLEGGDWYSRLFEIAANQNVRIAVVYQTWFRPPWIVVGHWEIQNNRVCGYHIVTFYAINNTEADILKNNLVEFESSLPNSVIVSYP